VLQRPLTGGPLAVDLLNTCWRDGGRELDLLADLDGLAQWMRESGQADVPADEPVRAALVHARAVIRGAAEKAPGADDAVNGVLARGLIVRGLSAGRVRERVLFADEAWAPAWHATADYLWLAASAPDGVRRCDQPDCVLYFFDPSGRRRWCSMAGCGNRAKARRHHARRATGAVASPDPSPQDPPHEPLRPSDPPHEEPSSTAPSVPAVSDGPAGPR
jgi:predicted RNA-binding Zn ribbon-like protein